MNKSCLWEQQNKTFAILVLSGAPSSEKQNVKHWSPLLFPIVAYDSDTFISLFLEILFNVCLHSAFTADARVKWINITSREQNNYK